MTHVKTCFLMDVTASMEPWIQAAKNHIRKIVNNLPARTQVAFVGYRDYHDDERFIVRDFCDVNTLLAYIYSVHASGGDDIAEDVAGGLNCVSKLNWDGADVKTIIHIADAPAHGNDYHEPGISDAYPDGDVLHNISDILRGFSHQNIDYTFVRTEELTDRMIDKFSIYYSGGPGQFKVVNLREQGERGFVRELTQSITASITRYSESQDPV